MLLDTFMPEYDFSERHETVVRASQFEAYRAVRNVDLARSLPIAALLLLRGVPHILTRKLPVARHVTIDYLLDAGFVLLAEAEPEEVVLGVVGKLWRLDSSVERILSEEFKEFDAPGYAKATLNFTVDEIGPDSCIVATETRIACTDAASKQRFGLYWRLIGPFSGLIRRWTLDLIRGDAEAESSVLREGA